MKTTSTIFALLAGAALSLGASGCGDSGTTADMTTTVTRDLTVSTVDMAQAPDLANPGPDFGCYAPGGTTHVSIINACTTATAAPDRASSVPLLGDAGAGCNDPSCLPAIM